MLVLLLLVLLVSVILFIAIPFAIVGYASKHQLTLDYKKWLRIVWAFLKKRSDTKVFLAFMSIEAGLAGILPQVYLLRFETQYFNLWFEKGGNAEGEGTLKSRFERRERRNKSDPAGESNLPDDNNQSE